MGLVAQQFKLTSLKCRKNLEEVYRLVRIKIDVLLTLASSEDTPVEKYQYIYEKSLLDIKNARIYLTETKMILEYNNIITNYEKYIKETKLIKPYQLETMLTYLIKLYNMISYVISDLCAQSIVAFKKGHQYTYKELIQATNEKYLNKIFKEDPNFLNKWINTKIEFINTNPSIVQIIKELKNHVTFRLHDLLMMK